MTAVLPDVPVADERRGWAPRLLLIDEDLRLAMAVRGALNRRGYRVHHVRSAAEALRNLASDLILLDLRLSGVDGLELCRRLRNRTDAGIIVATGWGEPRQRALGRTAGADDTITKPFGLLELHARLQAVLNRRRPAQARTLSVGALELDVDGGQAWLAGSPLSLTLKEFKVLAVLARTPSEVVARQMLVSEVWQTSWLGKSRTVDVHIASVRAKVAPWLGVENARGVGYRLVVRG